MSAHSFVHLLKIQFYWIGETPLLIFLPFSLLSLLKQMKRGTSELAAATEHRDGRNDDHYGHCAWGYYDC